MNTAASTPTTPTATRVIGALLALVCGTAIAAQTRINGALGATLADGYVAALLSFSGGLLIVATVVVCWPKQRAALRGVFASIARGDQPWWILSGGCVGALLVMSQGLAGAVIGAAIFTVCTVAGQTASGLLVDKLGLGPAPPMNPTRARVLGAVIAVIAVAVGVSDRFGAGSVGLLALLPLIAGFGLSYQSAVNGRVREVASLPVASLGNFAVGTGVLVIIAGVHALIAGVPDHLPTQWWLYLGGPIGLLYITINAAVVRHTGTLLLALASIAGQLIGALILDEVVPVNGQGPSTMTLVGAALTLLAMAVTLVRVRR